MTVALAPVGRQQLFDEGVVAPGAVMRFYLSGTSTPYPVYASDGTSLGTSLTADTTGLLPACYLAPIAYRIVLENAEGAVIWPAIDNVTAGGSGASAGLSTFDVQAYGATGDGTTNDAAAIQAAIDACVANGGGTVFFPQPPSSYKITSGLTIAVGFSDVTLQGVGSQGLCDIKAPLVGGTALTIGANTAQSVGWFIRNLRLNMEGATGGAHGILATRTTIFGFDNVEVKGRTDGVTQGSAITISGDGDSSHNSQSTLLRVRGDWAVGIDFKGWSGHNQTCNNHQLQMVTVTRNTSKPGTATVGIRTDRYCGDMFFARPNVEDYDAGYEIAGRYTDGFVRGESCTTLLHYTATSLGQNLDGPLFADPGDTVCVDDSQVFQTYADPRDIMHIFGANSSILRLGANIFDHNQTIQLYPGTSAGAERTGDVEFLNKSGVVLFTVRKSASNVFEILDAVTGVVRFSFTQATDDDTIVNSAGTGNIVLKQAGVTQGFVVSGGFRVPNAGLYGWNKSAGGLGAYAQMTAGDNVDIKNLVADKAVILETTGGASLLAVAIDGTQKCVVNSQGIHAGTTAAPFWGSGSGTPEGAIAAPIGSLWSRTDGGAATSFYVKESGTGNSGWAPK